MANEGFAKHVLDYVSFMLIGAVATCLCAKWMKWWVNRLAFAKISRHLDVKLGAMQDSLGTRVLERIELFFMGMPAALWR